MPKMEIDTQRFYSEGHPYVMSVINQLKDEAWKELVAARFSDNTPAELEIMEALWSHGYAKGAEAALAFLVKLQQS